MKTMTKTMRMAMALMALMSLTACDGIQSREFQKERADRAYRAAMDDYRAGDLAKAIAGLKKVCEKDPANASARFQLACLLQDFEKDYLGALCAFREYLMQQPGSDKESLAKDRLETCERELATALSARYASGEATGLQKTLSATRAEYQTIKKENERLSGELATARIRIAELDGEVSRLKSLMATDDPSDTAPVDTRERGDVKALFDEQSEGDQTPLAADEIANARKLLANDDHLNVKPMIVQSADAKVKREARKEADRQIAAERKSKEPLHEARPPVYVVQEGDTLYKIAIRFYGRSSAWSKIRNANKAIISTDGRVRAGQRLVLPAE